MLGRVSPREVYCCHGICRGNYPRGGNPSASLNKISEIYDRIGFAGVGKYSEFENLRKLGSAMPTSRAMPTVAKMSFQSRWRMPIPR